MQRHGTLPRARQFRYVQQPQSRSQYFYINGYARKICTIQMAANNRETALIVFFEYGVRYGAVRDYLNGAMIIFQLFGGYDIGLVAMDSSVHAYD